jgi:hypothetical protein
MAKSAAKNINSLESQTMVPTATIFGRLSRVFWTAMELDMRAIIPEIPFEYRYASSQNGGGGGETHHANPRFAIAAS